MSLYKMTMRRFKAVLAWIFAVALLVLVIAGVYYVTQVI